MDFQSIVLTIIETNKPSKLITNEIHEGLEKKVKDAENPLLGIVPHIVCLP